MDINKLSLLYRKIGDTGDEVLNYDINKTQTVIIDI